MMMLIWKCRDTSLQIQEDGAEGFNNKVEKHNKTKNGEEDKAKL